MSIRAPSHALYICWVLTESNIRKLIAGETIELGTLNELADVAAARCRLCASFVTNISSFEDSGVSNGGRIFIVTPMSKTDYSV
jgi:hypothetical protein